MISSRWLMGAIVVALLWTTHAAEAQPADQVDSHLQALVSSDDDHAVARARQELIRILKSPNPPSEQTVNKVAAAIPAALAPEKRELVRINAVLVAGAIHHPQAVSLLSRGMQDAHEAVRLPAAKGLANLSERIREQSLNDAPGWSPAIDELLKVLLAAQKEEPSARVVEETFKGITHLLEVRPDAVTPVLLDALAQRPVVRLRQPHARMQAELDALNRVYRRFVNPSIKTDEKHLKQLVQVSFQLMEASVVILESHEKGEITLRPQSQREYREMIRLGDYACRWAGKKLNPNLPDYAELSADRLTEARLRITALRAAFRSAPLNLSLPELKREEQTTQDS